MNAVHSRANETRKSWSERLKAWLGTTQRRPATKSSFKPQVESLEERDVPSTFGDPFGGVNLAGTAGLPFPSNGTSYQEQLAANNYVAQLVSQKILVPQEAKAVESILLDGYSPAMTAYLINTLSRQIGQPSILDGTTVTPQTFYASKTSISNNVNNVSYLSNPAGYDYNSMMMGGMGNIASMNFGPSSYYQMMNDPYIGLTSGYLQYEATLNYIQQHDVGPNGQMNYVAAANDIGYGSDPGVMGNLNLLESVLNGG